MKCHVTFWKLAPWRHRAIGRRRPHFNAAVLGVGVALATLSGQGQLHAQPAMGVQLADSYANGVTITGVVPGSPAERRGWEADMRLISVNDRDVTTIEDVHRELRRFSAGDEINVVVSGSSGTYRDSIVLADQAEIRRKANIESQEVLDAIEEINDKHGRYERDEKQAGKPIVSVTINASELSDKTLEVLSQLPHLTSIVVQGNDAIYTGNGWRHLQKCKMLKNICFLTHSRTEQLAGGDVLDSLSSLPHLRTLSLDNVSLDAEACARLSSLANLTALVVLNSTVDDAFLKNVAQLKNLETLNLRRTNVTPEQIQHLESLTQLKDLDLEYAKLENSDLKFLAKLCQLQSLDISRSGVTDEGLTHLRHLKALRYLSLNYTGQASKGRFEGAQTPFNSVIRQTQYNIGAKGKPDAPRTTGITSAGLGQLMEHLPELKELEVFGPKFEPSDLRKLGNSFRKTKISTDSKTVEPAEES